MNRWSATTLDGRTTSRGITTGPRPQPRVAVATAPTRAPHLHERVAGAAMRAGALVLGPSMVSLLLIGAGAKASELLPFTVVGFAFAFVVFLLERRDARWFEVLGRAALAGLVGFALAPVAAACAANVGAPDGVLAELTRLLGDADRVGMAALVGALLAPVWGILLFVRARTDRPWPQAVVGSFTGFLVALGLEIGGERSGGLVVLVLAAGGAIGGLALALADERLGERVDPAARPPVESGAGGLLWTWALLTLLGLGVVIPNLLVGRCCRCGSGASSAIGSLKAISTAQTMFSQMDKDGDGTTDYAASLRVLSAPANGALIDGTLGSGTKSGYTFTLVRDETNPTARWCVIANPIAPAPGADRRFWVDHAGTIHYALATTPAVTPDPTTGPPAGWTVIGK